MAEPGVIVTVTGAHDGLGGSAVTTELALLLAAWGHRVRLVGATGGDGLPDAHRLGTNGGFVELDAPSAGLAESRDRWLAEHDVVLIDGPSYGVDRDAVSCYHVPDLVVVVCAAATDRVRDAESVVRGWAYRRDLLPLDRAQLLVVPVLTSAGASDEGLAFDAAAVLCRNWMDSAVSAVDVLRRLAARPALAALIAHRCGRTELLARDAGRYVATARREPASAYAYDVVVLSDDRDRPVAGQLARSLRSDGLRVPEPSSFGVAAPVRPLLTRAVCVLAGPEPSARLVSRARELLRWDTGDGPVPRVITALLPRAWPSRLREPMRSGEWIRLEPGSRRIRDAARQVATLLPHG